MIIMRLSMTDDVYEKIEEIRVKTGVDKPADVIARSLAIYAALLKEREYGAEIISRIPAADRLLEIEP